MVREGQGYPCCQHDMMMMKTNIRRIPGNWSTLKIQFSQTSRSDWPNKAYIQFLVYSNFWLHSFTALEFGKNYIRQYPFWLWYSVCNVLTFDRAVNQETGASGARYRNIILTCGRVELSADATPTWSRCTSNNYITRYHRRFELVGVPGRQSSVRVAITVQVPVAVGDKMPLWEPAPDRGLGLSGPRLNSPADWGRSAAMVRGTWGQYVAVCSVFTSPLTHNQH